MRRNQPSATLPILQFLGTNLRLVLFVTLSFVGMALVYALFHPSGSEMPAIEAVVASSQTGSLWAPISKNSAQRIVRQRLSQSPGPRRIALIAGHMDNDSGAVCPDGLTETQVNINIANKVQTRLRESGISVELFSEFDERLAGFSGTALISIHADSCDDFGETATGFKMAGSQFTDSSTLSICLQTAYAQITGMPYHADTITPHMTDYHAFREIALGTPAIIIETGFMNQDREMLTVGADLPAQAITDGISCFLRETQP